VDCKPETEKSMKAVMMKTLLAAGSLCLALPPHAAESTVVEEKRAGILAAACDTDKDGMVSKAEMMAYVEKAFNKADSDKRGMLDRKQLGVFIATFDPGKVGGN
jgi:hypothetical protein